MRALLRQLVLLLALALAATPAYAGPDEDRALAEKRVQEGLTAARAKKFREAIAKFEEAFKLFPRPEIQHNLARAHEELNELKQAYDYFSKALEQDYTFAADGRQRLARIEGELRKTHARLTVRTTPTQTKVVLTFADGMQETHGSSPFQTWAPAGTTKLVGTNPSFKTGEQSVELAAGEQRDVALVLQPVPKQGFLQVSVAQPGATVSLSGRVLGKSPINGAAYDAGVYELEVTLKGYKPHREQVTIAQDQVASVNVALELEPGVTRPAPEVDAGVPSWIGWSAVGVGTVGLGVAAYLQFGKALPTEPDPVKDANLPDDVYNQRVKDAEDYQNAALYTSIAGGVILGTGIYLLVAESGDDAPSTGHAPSFVPTFALGPDSGHVGALLRF